ncbi:bifunctional serine/threonine-protein kinase/formylglycine-generating enzyme family protein [Spirulina sp. CCNP1310]|uniref:bifunctional serine/threonine-protein kinase/formylglycine-generating enzyme family protein n=1 Tax=Spirulina sp. CCNP1310 TaxID=3110249 RepID=UPI002B1F81E0|nr:bifunctional serine/threonine-protein kinase/formylglycine-generating enzyme family protein [Spirulina sp. CCNP1310]MEA5420406.1 bifunctional serine/threonine-protein kinase/formylglycine-generating enzyme family protein [Spirulina sp. CCNP1310]
MVWEPGTQIFGNRYAIVKPIKKGGFGITYLVKDPKGQQFVLKTLKDEVMTEAEYIPFRDKFLRDFDRETAKIAICRHRYIVEVVNHFTHEGLPCMVMEYIQGQDLGDRVARGGALPEAVALRYIRQVGAALNVMHEKGLLHRDIKPQNIMVRLPANEAVLIDFGIAREFIPNLTQTHTTFYTPCYAPIEQYDEQEHRGEFTDVYALAATLYYLLTGVLPPIATMRVRRDRLEIPQHWSVELQNAIQQGMAVEPDDRPQTVAAWLALLPNSGGGLPSFSFETVRVNDRGEIIQKIPGQARFYPQDLGDGVRLEMVEIPGGTFLMGTEEAEIERLCKKYDKGWFRWESPQHSVQVSPFWMGKTPVTQEQWRVVVTQVGKIVRDLNPDPSNFKGGDRPVEQVSWYDAVEWCARLSKLTGKEYRLPSEAEWEYACRAGTKTPFAFGETITPELVNYDGNYTFGNAPKGQYREETTPVASFPPNGFGLYDCHGNVWEWCFDPFHENYQGAPGDGRVWDENVNDNRYQKPSANLKVLLKESGSNYVLRGGSWYANPVGCRSANRNHGLRGLIYDLLGFRVCLVGAGLF